MWLYPDRDESGEIDYEEFRHLMDAGKEQVDAPISSLLFRVCFSADPETHTPQLMFPIRPVNAICTRVRLPFGSEGSGADNSRDCL